MSRKNEGFYSVHSDFLELKRTQHHSVSLTFIGDVGVGKTTFIEAYGNRRPIQTLHIGDNTIDVHIMDTENIQHHEEVLRVWYKMTSLLVLCYDMTDSISLDNIAQLWMDNDHLNRTKLDLVEDMALATIRGHEMKQFIKAEDVIFTSTIQKIGLDEFKECLVRILGKKLVVPERKPRFFCF
ncbi:PREDICTED: ras-related protein Rab-24-like isoform X2 [Nicrophorus vespilloides]|uniref:Ras-related protein Rab-24-like isoform X2 n=1 Tax=Nicrophorus vespilloides TaxID=110193 RepID=A0ABM1MRU5_NICVS|nr:PREDICTED: ras-related protein Rab-24-like isoform X2 [Nicrophorus vespilloides]